MENFEEFLLKVKDLKTNYAAGQIKLDAPAIYNLIMAGAFDSLLGGDVSLEERYEAIERYKKFSKSSAQLPKSKTAALGMNEIKDEFTRKLWLTGVNPLFTFKVCDYYHSALEHIGFKATGAKNLKYRKEQTQFSEATDIFGSFNSLFMEKTLRIYGNRNTTRRPAIVGIYQGYETKFWGDGNEFKKIKISDGASENIGTLWPKRGTQNQYDIKMREFLKTTRGKACIFMGKVGVNKRGYQFFTLQEIIPLG